MADATPLPFEPEEAWRPVVGFEGWYEVSDHGRVRSIKTRKNTWVGRVLRDWPDRKGYRRVGLYVQDRCGCHSVHRLVAEAFLGPCPVGHQVNHRNGDKGNNRAANLEYATSSENNRHALRSGLREPRTPTGERNFNARLTEQDVAEIRRRYKRGVYGTPRLGREFGVNESTIRNIIAGRTWKETL